MILTFVSIIVPEQAESMKTYLSNMTMEEQIFFLESILMDGDIHISTKPATDSFDIDRLAMLYDAFPFITHEVLNVPIRDSNGKIRFIPARRNVIAGRQYIFRLKQFAEDKFSSTSLSATNICGYNHIITISKPF